MNARATHRLLLTLRLGEVPEHLPEPGASPARYGMPPAERIDGASIDRLLRHHGDALRVHAAAQRARDARARRA